MSKSKKRKKEETPEKDGVSLKKGGASIAKKHFKEGEAFLKSQELDKAIKCFEKSVTISPRNTQYNNALGEAYLEYGKFVLAAKYFSQAVFHIRKNTNASKVITYKQNKEKAIKMALKSGYDYLSKDKPIEAYNIFNGLDQINGLDQNVRPKTSTFKSEICSSYLKCPMDFQKSQSLSICKEVAPWYLNPVGKPFEIVGAIGVANFFQKNYIKAVGYLEIALEFKHEADSQINRNLKYMLAHVYVQTHQNDKGLKVLNELALGELSNERGSILYQTTYKSVLTKVYYDKDDLTASVRSLDDLLGLCVKHLSTNKNHLPCISSSLYEYFDLRMLKPLLNFVKSVIESQIELFQTSTDASILPKSYKGIAENLRKYCFLDKSQDFALMKKAKDLYIQSGASKEKDNYVIIEENLCEISRSIANEDLLNQYKFLKLLYKENLCEIFRSITNEDLLNQHKFLKLLDKKKSWSFKDFNTLYYLVERLPTKNSVPIPVKEPYYKGAIAIFNTLIGINPDFVEGYLRAALICKEFSWAKEQSAYLRAVTKYLFKFYDVIINSIKCPDDLVDIVISYIEGSSLLPTTKEVVDLKKIDLAGLLGRYEEESLLLKVTSLAPIPPILGIEDLPLVGADSSSTVIEVLD